MRNSRVLQSGQIINEPNEIQEVCQHTKQSNQPTSQPAHMATLAQQPRTPPAHQSGAPSKVSPWQARLNEIAVGGTKRQALLMVAVGGLVIGGLVVAHLC